MEGNDRTGAYGFRLLPNDPSLQLPDLVASPDGALTVTLEWSTASALQNAHVVEPGHYWMAQRRGGSLEVTHATWTISCVLPVVPTAAAVVHPLLTMPLSFLASWRGDVTLHGGAFVRAGLAWIVCGEPMAGKSTILAALAQRGVPILADDLAVISDGAVWAGPQCVDLRPDVAARVPSATSIGLVAGRERFRLPTPPAPQRAPLAGIVVLGWSTDDRMPEPIDDLGERLAVLHGNHYAVRIGPLEPRLAMGLLDVGMWRLQRAPDWARADHVVDQLLELTGGHRPPTPAR